MGQYSFEDPPWRSSSRTRTRRHHEQGRTDPGALGGDDNIDDLEACITRLRVEVDDPSLVDEPALKAAGAFGVVQQGRSVQVVVGPEADTLAEDIEDLR